MLTPPPDLDAAEVAGLVRGAWALPLAGCRYLAEGTGSHHWLGSDEAGAERWFITADRVRTPQAAEELQACFTVVGSLSDRLPFVLGPRPAIDGSVTVPAGREGSLLLSVREYLRGETGRFGEFADAQLRFEVLRSLAQLHALPVPDLLPRWRPDAYASARSAVMERDSSWAGAGPFAEEARRLVRINARSLTKRLDEFATAAADLASHRHDVITHGEPHAANVLVLSPDSVRASHSRIALLDWDTVRAGPRERDLAVILPDADSGDLPGALSVYLDAAGADTPLDHEVIALFREEWSLNDIDVYLTELRAPHADTDDTKAALRFLGDHLTG